MRKPLHFLLAALLALASPAVAQDGLNLDPAVIYVFTDCASGGSAAQTIPEGRYLVTLTDADAFLCIADSASTCASLGSKFPVGTVIKLSVGRGGKSMSCRSASATADFYLTRAN